MRIFPTLFGILLILNLTLSLAWGEGAFDFMAFGDIPYTRESEARFLTLIDELNRERPVFSIHVGDTKNGSTLCNDRAYGEILRRFSRFRHPLFYTPGDNEWTDCHRFFAGSYDPVERLQYLREVFFTSRRLDRRFEIVRQSDNPVFGQFSENLRWRLEPVLFATLHVVGSNNNNQPSIRGAQAEYAGRNRANIAWLREAFAEARSRGDRGIVLFMHADPRFGIDPKQRSGFNDFHEALLAEVRAYEGEVLLVHGDSHIYRIDKPLRDSSGQMIPNFTRVVVFGDSETWAVRFTVDPSDPALFTVRPYIPDVLKPAVSP